MADERYNTRNPAVKRILQEVREMQNNVSDEFMSLPVQDNIFEWQFAIRGPQETEFEGGIYHGRIQLPPEYPFRPPAFMLLTPNGRFETQTKICLSISQHHPEHWQPSWSVRTALIALIAFMPTKPEGASGSLDYTKEERRALAIKSRIAAPKFGNSERQQLIDEIHEHMLKKGPPVPIPSVVDASSVPDAAPIGESEAASVPADATIGQSEAASVPAAALNEETGTRQDGFVVNGESEPEVLDNVHQLNVHANVGPVAVSFSAGLRVATRAAPLAQDHARGQAPAPRAVDNRGLIARLGLGEELGLTLLAICLTVLIVAILLRKLSSVIEL